MKKNIQDYKKEAILNKVFRYDEGVMTRREWLNLMRVKGAYVEESTKNRIQFNRIKYNRMKGGIWSNEQEEYEKKCAEIVPCYNLKFPSESSFFEITKTEYDYFKGLELSEDINTQKMELTHKIEAGTATDEEIQEDENRDFEFFHKYAR